MGEPGYCNESQDIDFITGKFIIKIKEIYKK